MYTSPLGAYCGLDCAGHPHALIGIEVYQLTPRNTALLNSKYGAPNIAIQKDINEGESTFPAGKFRVDIDEAAGLLPHLAAQADATQRNILAGLRGSTSVTARATTIAPQPQPPSWPLQLGGGHRMGRAGGRLCRP